jgi:hypothetical protein
MQSTDLGPILHVDHALPPRLEIEPGSESKHPKWWTRPEGGQFSTGDRGSVFSQWRQASQFTTASSRPPEPSPPENALEKGTARAIQKKPATLRA